MSTVNQDWDPWHGGGNGCKQLLRGMLKSEREHRNNNTVQGGLKFYDSSQGIKDPINEVLWQTCC